MVGARARINAVIAHYGPRDVAGSMAGGVGAQGGARAPDGSPTEVLAGFKPSLVRDVPASIRGDRVRHPFALAALCQVGWSGGHVATFTVERRRQPPEINRKLRNQRRR